MRMRTEKQCISAAVVVVLFLSFDPSNADLRSCRPSSNLTGKMAPSHRCNRENDSGCCKQGKNYPVYECSPPVTRRTRATLTVNVFETGEDGGGMSPCDGKFHSNNEPIVSLSTGWFNKGSRCRKNITIYGNSRKVNAVVVDQCDSTQGCDAAHDFQPPCRNNIIDASEAVWKALQVPKNQWGQLEVFWSDASPGVRNGD